MTSRPRRARHLAALALVLFAVSAGATACRPPPKTHVVAIDGTAFTPDVLTVKAGDAIVWVNKDPFPHTVTSAAGGFDSKALAAGESWSDTATRPGQFLYVCTFHPTMKGTLRVE